MTATTTRVVLLGRTQAVLDQVISTLARPGLELSGGTDIGHLRHALDSGAVEHVIIGGGLDLRTRLDLVEEVFTRSADTTVHLNSPSGPDSFLPFVAAILAGMGAHEPT